MATDAFLKSRRNTFRRWREISSDRLRQTFVSASGTERTLIRRSCQVDRIPVRLASGTMGWCNLPPFRNGPGEQAGSLPDDRLHEKSGNKFAASHRVQMFNQHFIRALDHGVKPCLTCFGDVKDGVFLNMEDKVTKST